ACVEIELEYQFYYVKHRPHGRARLEETTTTLRRPTRKGHVAREEPMSGKRPDRGPWAIVAMLFFFMLINFADKAIIGLAGVPIMAELNLTPKQFGLVGSSFFLLFSVSAVVTGFIVNRVRSKWALFAMGLIWSLAQIPMLGTVGVEVLIASRIIL